MCSFPQLTQSHAEFRDAITPYPSRLRLPAPQSDPPVLLCTLTRNPQCDLLPLSPSRSVFCISSLTNFLPLLLLSVHFPRSFHSPPSLPPIYPPPRLPSPPFSTLLRPPLLHGTQPNALFPQKASSPPGRAENIASFFLPLTRYFQPAPHAFHSA